MHKATKYATTAAAVVCGLGAVTASASANVIKTGGGAFSGLSASGSGHSFTATGNGGTVVVTCGTASFSNISGTGTDKSATFTPTYTNCSADISGIACAATVTTPGPWTLVQGATKTGGWTGTANVGAAAKVVVNDPGCGLGPTDCTINIPAQSGLTGTSVLAKNSTTNIVNLSGTVTGITWNSSTSGCGIGTGASTATYSINGTSGINIAGIQLT